MLVPPRFSCSRVADSVGNYILDVEVKMTTDSAGQAGELTDVEITPAMLEAGAAVIRSHVLSGLSDEDQEVARDVLLAMLEAAAARRVA